MSTEDDILAGLEPDPPPFAPRTVPVSQPVQHPAQVVTSIPVSHRLAAALPYVAVLIVVVVVTIGGTAWWIGPRSDGPAPTVNAVELGRRFVPILAGTLADGFDAEADSLEAGKDLTEANKELKRVFDANRKSAFETSAGSLITSILADGKPIETPEVRRALVNAHRDFAKGLRGLK